MLSIYDRATAKAALAQTPDPQLRELLTRHWSLAEANGLTELTHILVIHADDGEDDIEAEIGFSPMQSPIDQARYGTPTFQPYWSWLAKTDGWYEMIVTSGNSGFAFILLIEMSDDDMPGLRQLCEEYARCA